MISGYSHISIQAHTQSPCALAQHPHTFNLSVMAEPELREIPRVVFGMLPPAELTCECMQQPGHLRQCWGVQAAQFHPLIDQVQG